MDMKTKVEHLAGEITQMKEELSQTMAEMRQILSGLQGPPSRDASSGARRARGPASEHAVGSSATAKSQTGAAEPRAESGDPREAVEGGRKVGGLSLSPQDLDLMLREAGTDSVRREGAGGPSSGKVGLPLERLVRALKDAPGGARRAGTGTGRSGGELTLSLGELAQMLKESQAEAAAAAKARRPVLPVRSPEAIRGGAHHPLVGGSGGADGRLDVNLMANLMRWVGSVKCRLGLRQMRPLVELYSFTGHLAPIIENAIAHLAGLSVLPDESDHHVFTQDDVIDALLQLHGINYGSGSRPVGSAMDLDLSERPIWPTYQENAARSDTPEDVAPTDPVDEPADDEEWEIPTLDEAPLKASPAPQPVSEKSPQGRQPSRRAYLEALSEFRAAMLETDVSSGDAGPAGARGPVPAYISGELALSGQDQAIAVGDVEQSSSGQGVGVAREAYPSDVTDGEWRRLEALIPPVKPGGRPGKYERREILNGILYQTRTGSSWRSLPHDLPPWKIVHHYYRTWRSDGTWETVDETLADLRREYELPEGGATAWVMNGLSPRVGRGGTEDGTIARESAVVPRT